MSDWATIDEATKEKGRLPGRMALDGLNLLVFLKEKLPIALFSRMPVPSEMSPVPKLSFNFLDLYRLVVCSNDQYLKSIVEVNDTVIPFASMTETWDDVPESSG